MRHIRNFLHNINDIVLAIVIVLIAAGIIYWRMQIILDYPKKLANEQATYEQEQDASAEEAAEETSSEEAQDEGSEPAEEAADEEAADEEAADDEASTESVSGDGQPEG